MGHKGVSKRKPKKSRPVSSAVIGGSSNIRSTERLTVQSLVKDKSDSLNGSGANPSIESNKKRKKGI